MTPYKSALRIVLIGLLLMPCRTKKGDYLPLDAVRPLQRLLFKRVCFSRFGCLSTSSRCRCRTTSLNARATKCRCSAACAHAPPNVACCLAASAASREESAFRLHDRSRRFSSCAPVSLCDPCISHRVRVACRCWTQVQRHRHRSCRWIWRKARLKRSGARVSCLCLFA